MRSLLTGLVFLSSITGGNSFAQIDPDQKTVFLTGANRGIGLEFVKQFAARDWNVIATTRKPDSSKELQALASAIAALSSSNWM
jgi:NAD(P)-dependent dehydrogenase (short-subunit alcohol dehydrogenase family)